MVVMTSPTASDREFNSTRRGFIRLLLMPLGCTVSVFGFSYQNLMFCCAWHRLVQLSHTILCFAVPSSAWYDSLFRCAWQRLVKFYHQNSTLRCAWQRLVSSSSQNPVFRGMDRFSYQNQACFSGASKAGRGHSTFFRAPWLRLSLVNPCVGSNQSVFVIGN